MSRRPGVDPELLAAAVGRHLGGPVTVEGLRRLSGGASRETWSFDACRPGDAPLPMVLRRDPGAAHGWTERATEFHLLRAAGAAGVPVPPALALLDGDDHLGQGFLMTRIEGETIARRILRDDEYVDARALLAQQCGEVAARIHAVDASGVPGLEHQDAAHQVAQYQGLVDGFGEPHPAFELAFRWLRDHLPEPVPARLVHGDFRNGNFIVGPEGLRAVLDWELAHLGDPVEDLGWLCVRSWRFGNVDRRVGGFGDLDQLLDAYAAAGGGAVDPEQVRFWEVLGTLKWGVICQAQCATHLHGIVRSVELAALGRRVAETEWDLLDLVTGPDPGPDPAWVRVELSPESAHDRPDAAGLVEAVREYLERDVQPGTEGRLSYHARVAANVLGMVERELILGPAQAATAHHRLAALLGRDAPLADLVRDLAAGIRAGTHTGPATVTAVRELVRAKLEVTAPDYADGSRAAG